MSEETLNILNELTKKETTDLALIIMELTADNMVRKKEIERLNNIIKIMEKYFELIVDLGYDYDGLNSEDSLKRLRRYK